ncbi:hypothetical protein RISW2_20280 [Roseivivax isoporae LMG 25204]|uniref:DUF4274 domain-containing protein n=1 Tax=Roseivivax isoporae LMG 25204 TaxID=1449351 RepID=X7FAY8_9RHOB|nr:hypothetical protein RISW2_20280 [Roseivivax isoporae LMG 25204]
MAALSPALLLVLFADPGVAAAGTDPALGPVATTLLAGGGVLFAFRPGPAAGIAQGARGGTAPDPSSSLLRGLVRRNPSASLPPPEARRAHVALRLAGPALEDPDPAEVGGQVPQHADAAIAAILARIAGVWGVFRCDDLSDGQVLDLFMLDRVLTLPPDEAGGLATLFRHPDRVLSLRDKVAEIAERRRRFEESCGALEATRTAWRAQSGRTSGRTDLVAALQSLGAPDQDLWHKVVTEHDPEDPDQAMAALWCVRQRNCDQASVAIYLGALAASGQLDRAARAGDLAFLAEVRRILEQWNAGLYLRREIALEPPDQVVDCAPMLSAALTRAAAVTGTPRLPDPVGLFVEYRGRLPQPRDAWSLRTGLVRAPRPADYLDPQAGERAARTP